MLKKLYLIILVCSSCIVPCYSQSGISYTPVPAAPSPNTQNLGVYGEVPVSLFSGLPQISVPIYQLSSKGITLPVNASYHASGTKIDQHPSWIGLGWSLVAGGSIDRVQRGIPDEKNYSTPQTTGGVLKGFYSTYTLLDNTTNWSSSFLFTDINSDGTDKLNRDLEPDDFQFSYPGNSGRFFLNEKGVWCVQSEKPVKVVTSEIGVTPLVFEAGEVFRKFALVDGMGYKYVYGGVEPAIEYSDRYYPNSTHFNYFSATSWKLTQIIAPSGELLFDLEYERGPTIIQLYIAAYKKTYSGLSGSWGCGSTINSWSNSLGYPERGNLISPVYLKSVKCEQIDVKLNFKTSASNEMSYLPPNANHNDPQNNPYLRAFIGTYKDENGPNADPSPYPITPGEFLTPQFLDANIPYFQTHVKDMAYWKNLIWLKLDKIEITNTAGTVIKRSFRFDYDNSATERLRLSGIAFLDAGATSQEKYQFKYNNQSVARYLESVGDHWGFYNNGPTLPSIYSSFSNDLVNIANYKGPSLQYTRAGVLQEIVYPTGGNTKFEYELNSCSKVASISAANNQASIVLEDYLSTVGGLRVKKIINDDATGGTTVKEYLYVKGYAAGVDTNALLSSGILHSKPKYSSSFNVSTPTSFSYQANFSNPVIPLTEFSSGSYIGYSEVVEKRSDGAYTVYKYTNHDNGYGDEIFISSYNGDFNYQFPVSSRAHDRGKLLEETMFSNLGIPVSRISNTYTRNHTNYARAIRNGKESFCSVTSPTHSYTLNFNTFHKSAYKVFYNSLQLETSLARTYAQSDPLQFVDALKSFKYNANGDVAEEKLISSSSDVLEKKYRYPTDKPGIEPYQTMSSRYIISPVIEESSYKNGSLLESTRNGYDFWNGSSWSTTATNLIVPRLVETKEKNQTAYEPRLRYHTYDTKGNATSVSKESGAQTSYIWAYKQSLPIAKIENSTSLTGTSLADISFGYHHFMNQMSNGTTYAMDGSSTFSQAGNATIARTYYKSDDHEAWFYTYIYNSSNSLVASFSDKMEASSTALTVTGQVTLPAGTYTMKVKTGYQPAQSNTLFFQEIEVNLTLATTVEWTTPFHTSFEEDTNQISTSYAKTGQQCHLGNFTVKVPPTSSGHSQLTLSYWGKVNAGTPWTYVEQIISAGSNYADVIIGNGYAYIDEVRLYPKNAVMTTYTYQPTVGMTSQTDAKGMTIYYEYDIFGRLKYVKDQNGNILKQTDYHYKN